VKQRKVIDTTDHQIGQPGDVTMSSTGPAVLEKPDIQVVDGPRWDEKAAILAFMNEVVTVVVHTTTDKHEPQFVQLWNDGRFQLIPRGIETPVKRKFIEVLARMKGDSYGNVEYRDAEGNLTYKYPKQTGLRFPFAVVNDPNPNGRAWLQGVLAEAG